MPPLGAEIGRGVHRIAYAHRDDPDVVVKVLRHGLEPANANLVEWLVWQNCSFAWKKVLAPCLSIAPDGFWLTQARTQPLDEADLPPWPYGDRKVANFGRLNGAVVCHDYGSPVVMHGVAFGSPEEAFAAAARGERLDALYDDLHAMRRHLSKGALRLVSYRPGCDVKQAKAELDGILERALREI